MSRDPGIVMTEQKESLIEFPCDFPIKVLGNAAPGFEEAVMRIALRFDGTFRTETVERRPSSNGNYLGLTLTVHVTSKERLDELYRALCAHPMVRIAL
jgi:uncharacterized protein